MTRDHKVLSAARPRRSCVWGTAAQDEPLKIGVVDIDQAITSTDGGQGGPRGVRAQAARGEAALQPMIDRYKALEEDLKSKKFVLSDDALYQKQLDLAEMRNKIENKMKELEGQLQVDQERLRGPLIEEAGGDREALGQGAGLHADLRARGTPGLLYTREALDITDLVIEKYNQKG